MRAIRSIVRRTLALAGRPDCWWSGFQNWTCSPVPAGIAQPRDGVLPGPTIWLLGPIVEFAYTPEG